MLIEVQIAVLRDSVSVTEFREKRKAEGLGRVARGFERDGVKPTAMGLKALLAAGVRARFAEMTKVTPNASDENTRARITDPGWAN
jgi:hypothetical protein